MTSRISRRNVNTGLGATLISPALGGLARLRASHRADKNRLRHGADGSARRQRQAGAARREIWQEEVNAKGGLLGRQVQLINYDDQSNPANVPGIYTKC